MPKTTVKTNKVIKKTSPKSASSATAPGHRKAKKKATTDRATPSAATTPKETSAPEDVGDFCAHAGAAAAQPAAAPPSSSQEASADQGNDVESGTRMPPVGTVLQKKDRHGAVRCECTVTTDGVSYAGKVYKSLSAAAVAASRDLGLTSSAANGWTFWGLSKPVRAAAADPLAGLQRAWDRYQRSLEGLLEKAKAGEHKEPVLATLQRHARVLQNLHDEVA